MTKLEDVRDIERAIESLGESGVVLVGDDAHEGRIEGQTGGSCRTQWLHVQLECDGVFKARDDEIRLGQCVGFVVAQ